MAWQGFGRRDERVSLVLAAAMGAMAFGAEAPAAAHARMQASQLAAEVRSYAIPAGTIGMALNRLAEENGVQMVFLAGLTRNAKTGGLKGDYTLGAALDALLGGTGLSYRLADDEREVFIVLAQNDGVRNDASGAEALPPIDVGAEAPPTRSNSSGEPKTPAEGYVVTNATTAMKTDVPLRQTPVSVVVVPKQVMQDQNVTRIQEALENVSGVRSNSNDLEGYVYKIRGFTSYNIYRNSLAMLGDSSPGGFDTANLERIEVLKGPSSILYGRAEPGGLINLVTKKPLDQSRYVVEQQIGSYGNYRTQWDFSAPVSEIPGLAYRVSGAWQDRSSFRSFLGGNRVTVAPSVRYSPSAWTEFTVDAQYVGAHIQSDTGFPVWPSNGWQPASIPSSRSMQDPSDPRDQTENVQVSYNFRQNLDENWKLTNRFLYSHATFEKWLLVPRRYQSDQRTLDRATSYQSLAGENFSTNIDIEGKFTTFDAKHIFLFGLDYLNTYYDYYNGNNRNVFYPIDIYYPVYGNVPSYAYWNAVIGVNSKGHSSTLVRQKGFYVQDHVTFLDERAHLLLGARFDAADVVAGSSRSGLDGFSASKEAAIAARLRARGQNDTAWSPRVGLVYDFTPELSGYASYSESFGANNGISASGQTFPAQRGKQWEVGLKAQPLPEFSVTLAFYQLTRSNLLTRDFASPDINAQKPAGLQRSRGIELDVIGRVTDRLSLVANYAHTDAKVIADEGIKDPFDPYGSSLSGNHMDNAPRHSGKIFATYDFGENGLGLRLGAGVTAATQAWADIQNTYVMPGWARVDMFASYTALIDEHKLTAQVNLRNINSARYFNGTDIYFNNFTRLNLFPAEPLTVVGTLKFEW
jgi:iron complex outermembrane receptor protein